jgi:glc operon protein GlcG
MHRLSLTAMAACAVLMLGTTIHAQQPAAPPPLLDYGQNITLEQAMKAANAALAEAKKLNVLEGIAVVDTAGRLVYFLKMDNTRAIAVALAQHKARTAAMTKLPSKAYEDRVASGGIGVTVLSLDGVIASAGASRSSWAERSLAPSASAVVRTVELTLRPPKPASTS